MFVADKYLSVLWQKGGRSYPELDCYGIITEIRKDLGLPAWPNFAGVTKDDDGLDVEARGLMKQLMLCEPCEGAGVACYSGSMVTHVGIVVMFNGEMHVAECNPKTNVTFLPLARFKRRYIRVEFWQ